MKKINLYIIALVTVFLSACGLEESPSRITPDGLAQDKRGAELLINGVYSSLWSHYMMTKTYFECIEFDQDLVVGATWALTGAGMGNVMNHWSYNGDSDMFLNMYIIIAASNEAQRAFEASDLGDPFIAQRYGEALFLRAWAYFHLVRMYGPVPLRTDNEADFDCPRSPVADVYAQIETDLLRAIDHMKYKGSGEVGEFGHADKTAAQILLARVYCTMASGKLAGDGVDMYVNILNQKGMEQMGDPACSDDAKLAWTKFTTQKVMGSQMENGYQAFDAKSLYQKAEVLCDSVINRRGLSYDLKQDWGDIWGSNNYKNNEFVWGVVSVDDARFRPEGGPYYYTNKSYGGMNVMHLTDACWKMYNYDIDPNAVNDDRAVKGVFHYVKDETYDAGRQWFRFPTGDTRYNTAPDGLKPDDSNFYVMDATKNDSEADPDNGLGRAWQRPAAWSSKWYWGADITRPEVTYADKGYGTIPQDIILIRFAEVYLLRAEARNELDNPAGALADLNVIRNRVHAKPQTTTDKVQLRSYIFQERGLEFVFELMRKFDLVRWGMYLNVMNATEVTLTSTNDVVSRVREERSLLYPVPLNEVNQNKLFGGNNPGY